MALKTSRFLHTTVIVLLLFCLGWHHCLGSSKVYPDFCPKSPWSDTVFPVNLSRISNNTNNNKILPMLSLTFVSHSLFASTFTFTRCCFVEYIKTSTLSWLSKFKVIKLLYWWMFPNTAIILPFITTPFGSRLVFNFFAVLGHVTIPALSGSWGYDPSYLYHVDKVNNPQLSKDFLVNGGHVLYLAQFFGHSIDCYRTVWVVLEEALPLIQTSLISSWSKTRQGSFGLRG